MRHQLTIRFDEELAEKIEELAERESISLNTSVVRLLSNATGLDRPQKESDSIGDSLDWFIGSWTEEQVRELEESIADFEMVDEELWM